MKSILRFWTALPIRCSLYAVQRCTFSKHCEQQQLYRLKFFWEKNHENEWIVDRSEWGDSMGAAFYYSRVFNVGIAAEMYFNSNSNTKWKVDDLTMRRSLKKKSWMQKRDKNELSKMNFMDNFDFIHIPLNLKSATIFLKAHIRWNLICLHSKLEQFNIFDGV